MKKINIDFKKLGFGVSMFGALTFTWVKWKWNAPHNCWAVKLCSFRELFQDWDLTKL